MAKDSNMNALKHGAYALSLSLSDGDVEEFEQVHAELIEEWDPQTFSQKRKVENIAKNTMRKRGIAHYWQTKIDHLRQDSSMIRFFDTAIRKKADKFLEDLEAGKIENLTERDLAKNLGPYLAVRVLPLARRDRFKSESDWLDALCEVIVEAGLKDLNAMRELPELGDDFYDEGGILEKIMAADARIEAVIAKDIKELGQLKTMQAMGLGKPAKPAAAQPPAIEHFPLVVENG